MVHMNTTVIEVRDLQVGHGAVDEISFTVAKGEIHALLGRSGLASTAVLEVVSGHRRPTRGTVRVTGVDPYAQPDAIKIGTVWRDGGLFPGLTVTEVVDTWRRWTLDPLTRAEALRLTGLTACARTHFEDLTAAERRRLDLALALIGRSDVLFLDEPLAGLEGEARREVWVTLRYLASHGVTILVATRVADDACWADQVQIMDPVRPAWLRAA
jgi:ABC-2 type transport system ATP-binding protein